MALPASPSQPHAWPTRLTLALAALLCAMLVHGAASFISHPFADRKALLHYLNGLNSASLLPALMFSDPHEFTALAGAVVLATLLAGLAAVMAALIMWRAADAPANRQVAGLLLAFTGLCTLRFPMTLAPAWHQLYLQAPQLFNLLDACLLVYVALALARMLVIFPRAVDAESVHQTYQRRPWWLRWSGRASAQKNLLRLWHQHLVSGHLLWLALAGPLLLYALGHALSLWQPQDVWGGAAFAGMMGLLFFYFIYGLPYAFASLSHVHRFGTLDERRRVAWLRAVLMGLGLVLALSLLVPLLASAIQPPPPRQIAAQPVPLGSAELLAMALLFGVLALWVLLPLLAVMAVAFAVLNRGALDPRLAFTRVTLWSLMGLLVTLGFIAIERYAAVKLVQGFNLPPDSGAVAAGAIVTASFIPVRNLANNWITRLARRWIPLHLLAEGERVTRAVSITDLSGYTGLSATDEQQAILQSAALTRLAQNLADTHGGKLVKSLGDAVMLTFANATDALRAVQELHAGFPAAMAPLGVQPLPLHSAIHQGELVEAHDGDVFGQTVNLAARLADAAGAGQIVLSEQARSQLAEGTEVQDLGPKKFKNVPHAVPCYLAVTRQLPA